MENLLFLGVPILKHIRVDLQSFNNILVILSQYKGDYDRLCSVKYCLQSERLSTPAKPGV